MAELFENFVNDIDMSSLYKIALERSRWKAMTEGEAKGREKGLAEGRAEGIERANHLIQLLMTENRLEDLRRSVEDSAYREVLFEEFEI